MIARSRIRSSEFGARSHSARFASGNSVPVLGVVSNLLNWSKVPRYLGGSLWFIKTPEVAGACVADRVPWPLDDVLKTVAPLALVPGDVLISASVSVS